MGGQVPCDPGSAKDTRLNVGSHDVTSDVKVDADEFALPTGKHSSWGSPASAPHPRTAGKWREGCPAATGSLGGTERVSCKHPEPHRSACQKEPPSTELG